MAKITITNLNDLLDGLVTQNVNVLKAQAAVTNSTIKAAQAAASALSASNTKDAIDTQIVEIDGIAQEIEDSVTANDLLKTTIEGLQALISDDADQITLDKETVLVTLEDVLTAKSSIDVNKEVINELVEDFFTRYLGASLAAPNASWEGMELATGMIYYDIPKNSLMIYINANVWVPIIEAVNMLMATNNLADLPDKEAARVNLNVYSREETITLLEEQDEASEIAFDGTASGLAAENVQSAVDEIIAQKAQPSGIASLDVNGTVPASQLPSYVDDVIEVATYADLPAIGETGKIYIVVTDEMSNNDTSSYRWTGAVYAMVSNTLNAADIKALYESNANTNAFTDAEKIKLADTEITSQLDARDTANRNTDSHTDGVINGVYTLAERTKLSSIETNATADQTATEIEVLYEGLANTNKYTDVEKALVGTALQAETVTSLSLATNTLSYTDEDGVVTDLDLSLYLDDTNLARLVNGTLDGATGIATFTRDDATTFTVDFSALLDDTQVTVNNTLTSTSTTEALSANQGKILNDAIAKNTAVNGTATETRYDKILASLDIVDMQYTDGNLVTVRYEGDDDTTIYYRDVLTYDVEGDLTSVKHYYGVIDLMTESANTTLTYDVDKNLDTATYTEI